MKKHLVILLLIILTAFSLSSCNNWETEGTSSGSKDTTFDSSSEKDMLSPDEKRNIKVSFNVTPRENNIEQRIIAIMGENEQGNEVIEYAPSVYQFYLEISYKEPKSDVKKVVNNQIRKLLGASFGNYKAIIDIIENDERNTITVLFPDFESYYLCQEDLLNGLSESDSVLSVEVGYFDIQNGTTKPKSTYEYINVGYKYPTDENRHVKTYDEFVSLFEGKINGDEQLQKITEQTFEENYVFIVYNFHYREFDISDAKLIGDIVYITTNTYIRLGELVGGFTPHNACITFVPKSELGELPSDVTVTGIQAILLTNESM